MEVIACIAGVYPLEAVPSDAAVVITLIVSRSSSSTSPTRAFHLTRTSTKTWKEFFGGGSLKILSATAPRNLRGHDAKYLFCDEVDGMEILAAEGDPITIAEQRTLAHPDRKVVIGSTPTEEEISIIARVYEGSDQRVFEIRFYHCPHWFELDWSDIQWPEGKADQASAFCPGCGASLEERRKRELVEGGRWRVTKPEVLNHHGYRINALVLYSLTRPGRPWRRSF